MQNKSLDDYLKEANELVPRLSFEETIDFIKNKETVIIDVREESEVINYGLIKEAIHIPRGLIEFKLSPNSPNNPVEIKENTNICFFNNKGNPVCQDRLNGTMLCGKTEVGQEVCLDMTPATIF